MLHGVLEMFPRLAERRRAPGGGLSGGEQQVLATAGALLCQPELLLAEPTEGLEPKTVDEVVHLLQRLPQSGLSAIVVDQQLETVFDTCSAVHVMDRGHFAVIGTSAAIRADAALLAEHLGV